MKEQTCKESPGRLDSAERFVGVFEEGLRLWWRGDLCEWQERVVLERERACAMIL